MSLTKGLYVIFDLETTGFSKNCHHLIEISTEFLAPDGTGVNKGNVHSLVQPPINIPPIITESTSISNGYVADCQYF